MQNSSLYSQIQAQAQQQQQPQFPEQEQLKCPRCDSANTKFCYYNNYNLSQPRHFCRSCKRYWTKGGALRNIPVGGGSRKNSKRSSSTSSADSAASKRPAVAAASDVDADAAASVSKDKKDGDRDNAAGEVFDTMPLRGENFGGQFENLSFSSLLGSGGDQYAGLLDGLGPNGSGLDINGHFGDAGPSPNLNPGLEVGGSGDGDEFLNLQGGGGGGGGGEGEGDGDSGCWGGGGGGGGGEWPDLSIYTPSSNFQ